MAIRLRLSRSALMRNRGWRGGLVVLALFAIVTAVASLPYIFAGNAAKRPPLDPQIVHLDLPSGVSLDSLQRAQVSQIVDGDTIDVTLNGETQRIRYFGVDTPERGDACYREAADRNDSLVGKTVLLLPDQRDVDQYGRLLRYVFLPDGTTVDATLVAEGFGHAWQKDGRYRDQIASLEKQAQSAGRGCLWKTP